MAQHYELSASQEGTSPVPTSTSICDKYGCDWASMDNPRQQPSEPVSSQGRALLAAAKVSSSLVGTSTDAPKLRNERQRGGDAGLTWEVTDVPTPLRSASRAMRLRSRSTAGLAGQSRPKAQPTKEQSPKGPSHNTPAVTKESPVDGDHSQRLAAELCQAQKAQLTEHTEALQQRDKELAVYHQARRVELDGHIAELSEALQERDKELERARADCEQVRRQCLERDEVWLRVVTQTEADLRATQDELASERETLVKNQIENECAQSRLRQAHADDLDNRLSEFVDTLDCMEVARARALAAREDAERKRSEMEQAWNTRLSQITEAMNEQQKKEQELAEAARVDGDCQVVEECFAALAQRDFEIDETRRELLEAKNCLASREACWRRHLAQVEATAAAAAAAQTAASQLAPQRETYKVPAPLNQCITRSMHCRTFSALPELLTPISRQATTFEDRGEPLVQQRVSQRLQFGSPSALTRVDSSAQSTTPVLCWSPRHSPRMARVTQSAMPAVTLQQPTVSSIAATTAAITTTTRYLCTTPRLSGCRTVAGCASRTLLVRSPSKSQRAWRPATRAALSPKEQHPGEGLMSRSIFSRSAAVLPQVGTSCSCCCSDTGGTTCCSPTRAMCSVSTVPCFARVPSVATLVLHRDSTPQRQCMAQIPIGQPVRQAATSPRVVSPKPSPRVSLRATTPRMTPGRLSPRAQGSSLGVSAGSSINTPSAAVAAALTSVTVAAPTTSTGCRREPMQKQSHQASACSPSHSVSGIATVAAPTSPHSVLAGNGLSPKVGATSAPVRWECPGSPVPRRHEAL